MSAANHIHFLFIYGIICSIFAEKYSRYSWKIFLAHKLDEYRQRSPNAFLAIKHKTKEFI